MSIVPEDPDLADAVDAVAESQERRSPRSPDRPLLAAGEVRRRPYRCRASLSVDPGDLVSSGVFGLIDAIDRFDPERGVKFETFAAPRIRGAIYDGLRQLDWVPRSVRSRAREVEKAFSELEHELGRGPTDEELAEHLAHHRGRARPVAVGDRQHHDRPARPCDRRRRRAGGARRPGWITVAVDRGPRAAADLMRAEIRKLPEREKLVLSLYYDEGLTLAEIGDVLGVTESRVSQIHTKSVLHLRSRMSAAGVV